jgi:anti-anti-sigma regulatory factor
MLKITTQEESGFLLFKLEGDLAGRWSEEFELYWRSVSEMRQLHPVRVDLSSVTFIDEGGKEVLMKIHRDGAELLASGCMNNCIVEDIIRSVKREVRK